MSRPAPAASCTGRGNLVVLSAPSGTGKTTIARWLVQQVPGLVASVSYTTRGRREGEVEGKDYHFLERGAFEAMAGEGGFLEWAEIYGNLYGTGREATEQVLARGDDLLLVIDVQGARWVRRRMPEALLIFLMPPSREALLQRLRARGTESSGTEAQRLGVARDEIRAWTEYDYVIINDDLEASRRAAEAVVLAGRHTRQRMSAAAEAVLATFPPPAAAG